nr:MAG TPA: hypothetical protein [Caudoviricetes sp.]
MRSGSYAPPFHYLRTSQLVIIEELLTFCK